MVNYADKMVGQIVKQLENSGVRENTILIFTGDNGTDKPIITPWNGTEVVGGKGSMSDTGTRVPFIVNWPAGIKKPGRVSDELVEFTDMSASTLCEISGADLPKNHPADGSSIVPTLQNKEELRKRSGFIFGTEIRSWSVTKNIPSSQARWKQCQAHTVQRSF